MVTVEYHHEIAYGYDLNGRQYPLLTIRPINPADAEQGVDLDAYLDSGAERSLFHGTLAPIIGLNLLDGRVINFQSMPVPPSRQDSITFDSLTTFLARSTWRLASAPTI
jgi:hypothetical protein